MKSKDIDFVRRFQPQKLLAAKVAERLFPPLNYPPFVPVEHAKHVRPDDSIVGVFYQGKARAYPTWALDNYHIVNDRWDDDPVVVTA